MELATALGWWSGVRSDDTVYPVARPLYLLDAHWTDLDWGRHLRVAQEERPALGAVPDICHRGGLALALDQAAALAPFCTALLIIPKVDAGLLASLPREICGRRVLLGYSVPSRYGASPLPLWVYKGWPVHLLGGTPLRQLHVAQYLEVVSADGNMCQKLAHRGLVIDERGHGVPFDHFEPGERRRDMPYRALACSLGHIRQLWVGAGVTLEPRPPVAA